MAWLGRGKTKTSETQRETTTTAPVVISSDVERRTVEIGRELLRAARDYSSGVFSARFWNDQLMNWSMKDPAFKIQLFRFIDVFPCSARPPWCMTT